MLTNLTISLISAIVGVVIGFLLSNSRWRKKYELDLDREKWQQQGHLEQQKQEDAPKQKLIKQRDNHAYALTTATNPHDLQRLADSAAFWIIQHGFNGLSKDAAEFCRMTRRPLTAQSGELLAAQIRKIKFSWEEEL